jgi:hypothetical protein
VVCDLPKKIKNISAKVIISFLVLKKKRDRKLILAKIYNLWFVIFQKNRKNISAKFIISFFLVLKKKRNRKLILAKFVICVFFWFLESQK